MHDSLWSTPEGCVARLPAAWCCPPELDASSMTPTHTRRLRARRSFDGERRSCRASLERRNKRRHGKRSGATRSKARRAGGKGSALGPKKAAAASAGTSTPHTASGSGSQTGSGSGGSNSVAPLHLGTQRPMRPPAAGLEEASLESVMRAEVDAPLREAAALRGIGAGADSWAQQPQTAAAAYCVATCAEQQRWHLQHGLAAPAQSIDSVAPQQGAGRPRFSAAGADLRVLPLGEVPLGSAQGGTGQGLAALDVEDLLAIDAGDGGMHRMPCAYACNGLLAWQRCRAGARTRRKAPGARQCSPSVTAAACGCVRVQLPRNIP